MEYPLKILQKEIKELESCLKKDDLMRVNMQQATKSLKYISELKRAVKVIKAKLKPL